MVVFSEFPGMGSLWHCFTHMTGRGLRYPEAPQPCDPGSKIEPAELVHSFSHNFANPPAGGQMWTGISHETIGNTLNQCKSYGMVFGFSMTFRLILLIFQVVISNNHPQYGNGWDKSFTLWEQLLDCKPCHYCTKWFNPFPHRKEQSFPAWKLPNNLMLKMTAMWVCRKTSTHPIRSSALKHVFPTCSLLKLLFWGIPCF